MKTSENMIHPDAGGQYYELTDPVRLPKASGFLWNETMMIQASAQGYATALFMQPEPSRYSHAPNVEAQTFILPEQSYYSHHPGRFVYVKDEDDRDIFFSAPYEPVRRKPERFAFQVWKHKLVWRAEFGGLEITMSVSLPKHDPVELWRIKVKNKSERKRRLSLYPYFTVGLMSWMNQSGVYNEKLGAIVCSSVTPYQKLEDYAIIKENKDKTFLWASYPPVSWETSLERFEGEGGLTNPSALAAECLSNEDSQYEPLAAVMQYRLEMDVGDEREIQFMFGPAKDEREIVSLSGRYGADFDEIEREYAAYIAEGTGVLHISTPDAGLDNFVNNWLPRQLYYHGATNRMCTDPQTRNYLQDAMGMSYVIPRMTRDMILFAASQQRASGEMPDGILLTPRAELKYINQVPHSDHCVWLPIALGAYLDETGDYAILDESLPFTGGGETANLSRHTDLAMDWLIGDRDERGLSYIRQGDWCDPMNMAGHKGKGVSGWLTMAGAYALRCWAAICRESGRSSAADRYMAKADEMNAAVNRLLWDGAWYARGITDDGALFGVGADKEGKIYINAQSWAILCGAADNGKRQKMMKSVEEYLETPYGVEVLAPAYTSMREDIGRLTQKHPGAMENGSVYNHAASFYIYALYMTSENDNAFRLLRKMLPAQDDEDIIRRGQMPVFVPNYYRGAYRQFPGSAGRSSRQFNTGSASWVYRCLVDGLFGLRGVKEGLAVCPKLPSHWDRASAVRDFRGAEIHMEIRREAGVRETTVFCEGESLQGGVLTGILPGNKYHVSVVLPMPENDSSQEDRA